MRELPFPARKIGVGVVHERLPARSRTPLLSHAATEESVFILKGRGFIWLDGRRLPVRAGDSLHIRAGVVHGVETAGSSVEALSIFNPPMDARRPDVRVETENPE